MGSKVSDVYGIGCTFEFVYDHIKMLPNNPKRGKMKEFRKFIKDLKNFNSWLRYDLNIL